MSSEKSAVNRAVEHVADLLIKWRKSLLALFVLLLLMATGVLPLNQLHSDIHWPILIYLVCTVGFARGFTHMGIQDWIVAHVGQLEQLLREAQVYFLLLLGAVVVLLIWRHGYPAYLPAVLVFTVVNILLYGFNLVRMGALLSGEVRVLMDPHVVNVLPFLSMLMGNYLSTFGVLLLCTQYRALALRRQASQDPLTGLLNRRGFMERCVTAPKQGALVVLDLDDFKQINDRHGHEVGDRVLAAVGAYLAGQGDLVASRFGGEEFVLLLPEGDALAQQARCEQIRQGIATLPLDGIQVTASLGLVPYARGWHLDTLFGQADRALYQAKRSGKNRVCLPA